MAKKKQKKTKSSLFDKLKTAIQKYNKKRDKEYSKRLLTKIVNHSVWMMWASYVLAWFGKIEIAESLSKTIATSIIAVVIGYLAKSVIENISKNTTAFGENVIPIVPVVKGNDEDDDEREDMINLNRDC